MKAFVLSLDEYSRLIGKHRTTVGRWLADGMPAVRRKGPHGAHQVDVGPAIRWILDRLEADLAATAAPKESTKAQAARERKMVAEARLAELDVAEREGEVVPAAQVGERWAQMVMAARERLLVLPAVAVQRGLVPANREREIAQVVDEALQELAS